MRWWGFCAKSDIVCFMSPDDSAEQMSKHLEATLFGALEAVEAKEEQRLEKYGEHYGAILDILHATGVDLRKNIVGVEIPRDERTFPYGCGAAFVPFKTEVPEKVRGTFIFTQGAGDWRPGGLTEIEADYLEGKGHRVSRVSVAGSDLSEKQMLAAAAAIAMSRISQH